MPQEGGDESGQRLRQSESVLDSIVESDGE